MDYLLNQWIWVCSAEHISVCFVLIEMVSPVLWCYCYTHSGPLGVPDPQLIEAFVDGEADILDGRVFSSIATGRAGHC